MAADAYETLSNINVTQKGSSGGKGQNTFLIAVIWTSNFKISQSRL